MNLIHRICKPHKLEDVFTPTTEAKLNYVSRETIEFELEKNIKTPGQQIIVYGHSGSGKTTLLRNQLKKLRQSSIKTHCERDTTFESILLHAFDNLNIFYTTEKSQTRTRSISSELKVKYMEISGAIKASDSSSKTSKTQRLVPVQLTPLRLSEFMGAANCVWIIDDFHKVLDVEKQRIADVIKIFIDTANDYKSVKIICIGAVGTARELLQYDDNLNNRVNELPIPLMTDNELNQIVTKGFELMNLTLEPSLVDKVVYYSHNVPSVCHQICYDLCYYSNVKKTKTFTQEITEDDFRKAIDSFVRKKSDTYNKIYDKIVCLDLGSEVLKVFENDDKEFVSIGEIEIKIPKFKAVHREELIEFLELLSTSEYDEIIRFDRTSKKYSISTPFFKAFLKMKLALELIEEKRRDTIKLNRKQRVYELKDQEKRSLIIDDEFFESYYQYLDPYLIRTKKINEKIKELENLKKK
jgi:Holliday junction resolvasome RuvABC ATP-dependent DNA helicase subunit